MQASKIRLSAAEAALFCNAEVILTKNSVLQKTVGLLSEIQAQLSFLQSRSFTSTPKISRGENYRGLPYVVLDYPRIANGNDLYFIRSLFWWGNFFSSTLQVAGNYQTKSKSNLLAAYDFLSANNYYIGIHSDPWQHHFEPGNYRSVRALEKEEFEQILGQHPYTKIAAFWPLSEWDAAANYLVESWNLLTDLVP